ncbi:TPA: hypothetical protein ACH3X1_001922 [Trebouxia sp. C0004]
MSPGPKWAAIVSAVALLCLGAQLTYTHNANSSVTPASSRNAFQRVSGPSASQNKPLKAPPLSKQLVREHALNNTIIIAFANANHIDYTFNWLTYVFANNITNYLVGAIDPTTARTLSKAGVNFFSMYDNVANGAVRMPEGDLAFLSQGFLSIGLHKLALIRTVLGYKVDLVCSDVDTVWLQNPLPYFARFPEADILVSSDATAPTHDDEGLEDPQVIGRHDLNIGIMMLRCTKNMTLFVDAWQQQLQRKGGQHWDQGEFNMLLRINMFKNHFSWWDHTDTWDRVYKPKATVAQNKRIVWAYNHSVTVGVLPVSMFANGHIFFIQKLYKKLRSPLHVVHANFIGGGFKRHRFRESQLWLYDKPAYYNVDQLLSFDMRTLQPPADWLQLNTRQRVQFHLENIGTQLQQFWNAAGAAVALNRTLILPRFTCYCDELWYWSLEVNPGYKCRYVGARNQTLPFLCPHDMVVNLLQLDDEPTKFGAAVKYRESTFMENPRTPQAIKDDVVRITLQLPDQLPEPFPVPVQASQHLPEHLRVRQQLQQMAEPIVTQIPVSWTVTETDLRDTLSQHQSHRVLHMTDMGCVILNSYRGWDRRRSHASLDRWRFLLFASVH